MDVRDIVISEFRSTLTRRGVRVTPRLLQVAEAPFDLNSVQRSVDSDIDALRRELRFRPSFEIQRQIRRREQMHEERLRQLSRQYALQILSYARRGFEITESRAINGQRLLKEEAGAGCDVYPCERTQQRGR